VLNHTFTIVGTLLRNNKSNIRDYLKKVSIVFLKISSTLLLMLVVFVGLYKYKKSYLENPEKSTTSIHSRRFKPAILYEKSEDELRKEYEVTKKKKYEELEAIKKAGANKFLNKNKGKSWTNRSLYLMDRLDASVYCRDWGGRLPTISELRLLIKNCPVKNCGITNKCLKRECYTDSCRGCSEDTSGKYSVFGDNGIFCSSSDVESASNDILAGSWYVDFDNGSVVGLFPSKECYVRCIK
jgi:hypothetical protein